jgi:polyisoprenoid-binding protein YceI
MTMGWPIMVVYLLNVEVHMKSLLLISLIFISFSSEASKQLCTFDIKKDTGVLSWTAFKTPKKVGVKAKFSNFKLSASQSASVPALLESATIDVNSQSVDSGDKGRDAKIMTFFFKKMAKGTNIKGKVTKVNADKAQVEFTMNGVTKLVEMKFSYDEKSSNLSLLGKMDVLEFGLKDSLAAITKACYEKHEGVTWPDVELEFIVSLNKSCR